jgi:uncharacterized membrane protein
MEKTLLSVRDRLETSYWFIPVILTLLGIGVAFMLLRLDERIFPSLVQQFGIDAFISPSSAITLLNTIAASMATIVGTVFSITLVVLTLASQQYGPLIVNNFIRGRSSQLALGTFLGTFIYCIFALQSMHAEASGQYTFIPVLSIYFALFLAVLCVIVLIFYIHQVAVSIRPTSIIGRISALLLNSIELIYPLEMGEESPVSPMSDADQALISQFEKQAATLYATGSGYIDFILDDDLMDVAKTYEVTLELTYRPGAFITEGGIIGRVYPPEKFTPELNDEVNRVLVLSPHRTPVQDVELLFSQLVAVAIRALSPAINDPFTASTCIDRLGQALSYLSQRHIPSRYRYDHEGHLRVITNPITFDGMLHLAFDQIRHYGGGDLVIVRRLLDTIRVMGEIMHGMEDQQTLEAYASLIWTEARVRHPTDYARQTIDQAYQAACATLKD